MKNFIFKQEQYQTEATKAVVDCFASQTKGKRKDIVYTKTMFELNKQYGWDKFYYRLLPQI